MQYSSDRWYQPATSDTMSTTLIVSIYKRLRTFWTSSYILYILKHAADLDSLLVSMLLVQK